MVRHGEKTGEGHQKECGRVTGGSPAAVATQGAPPPRPLPFTGLHERCKRCAHLPRRQCSRSSAAACAVGVASCCCCCSGGGGGGSCPCTCTAGAAAALLPSGPAAEAAALAPRFTLRRSAASCCASGDVGCGRCGFAPLACAHEGLPALASAASAACCSSAITRASTESRRCTAGMARGTSRGAGGSRGADTAAGLAGALCLPLAGLLLRPWPGADVQGSGCCCGTLLVGSMEQLWLSMLLLSMLLRGCGRAAGEGRASERASRCRRAERRSAAAPQGAGCIGAHRQCLMALSPRVSCAALSSEKEKRTARPGVAFEVVGSTHNDRLAKNGSSEAHCRLSRPVAANPQIAHVVPSVHSSILTLPSSS